MERLIEMGWGILDIEKPEFEKIGDMMMKFFVMSEEGYDIVFVPQRWVSNDTDAKAALAASVREMVVKQNALAVGVLSDVWLGWLNWQDRELVDVVNRRGTAWAEKEGLLKRREALMYNIVTPIQTVQLNWFYKREGEKITFEEKQQMNPQQGIGRFAEFFPPQKSATA